MLGVLTPKCSTQMWDDILLHVYKADCSFMNISNLFLSSEKCVTDRYVRSVH